MISFLSDSRYGEKQRKAEAELTGIQLLSATAYQLKKPYQQLLIPITVWIGMEQAFIGADFTQVSLFHYCRAVASGVPSKSWQAATRVILSRHLRGKRTCSMKTRSFEPVCKFLLFITFRWLHVLPANLVCLQ